MRHVHLGGYAVEALKEKIITLVESDIREAHAIALFRREQVIFQEDLYYVIVKSIREVCPQFETDALIDEIAIRIEGTVAFQALPREFLDWADIWYV